MTFQAFRSREEITEKEWHSLKVDARCLDCGATMAGTSWCYRCAGKRLEYRTHHETPAGEGFWCGATARGINWKRPQDVNRA
jgi:hypothetical protein